VLIELADVLTVVDALLTDVLAILNAYVGIYLCPHPCLP